MDVEREFEQLSVKVSNNGRVRTSPRELVHLVGAQRRGAQIVDEIRSRLARHNLTTEPDFADVGADDDIALVPTDDHQHPFVETLTAAVKQLGENASEPKSITVRTMLSWFGALRRGTAVSDTIRATLAGFDLQTEPDFQSVHVDEEVLLVKRDKPPSEDGEGTPTIATTAIAAEEDALVAGPAENAPKSSTPTTFHVGTLDEANRPLVTTKPQTTLREAMSRMLTEQVSYLPILASEHRATGLLRWKDIGRYLLLRPTATLEDAVELAAVDPVVVTFEQPFLAVIPLIIQHGCILVKGPRGRIAGLITKKDLGKRLQELTSPFVTLGEIERGIRKLLERGEFTAAELREFALDPSSTREVKATTDLTLGEYQRLLQRPEAWDRLKLQLDRATFIDGLEQVRLVRNSVMHFDPQGPTTSDRKRLSSFLEAVYLLLRHADD